MIGLGFVVTAAVIFFSIISYDGDDPSFNTAVHGPIQNLMGVWGAYIGDGAVQYIGPLSYLLVLGVLVWGLRLLLHRPVKNLVRKILALCVGYLCLSSVGHHFGFYTGVLSTLFDPFITNLYKFHPSIKWGLLAFLSFAGMATYLYALSLSKEEWLGLLSKTSSVLRRFFDFILFITISSAQLIMSLLKRLKFTRKKQSITPTSSLSRLGDNLATIVEETHRHNTTVEKSFEPLERGIEPSIEEMIEAPKKTTYSKGSSAAPQEIQQALSLTVKEGDYQLPPLNLLQNPPGTTEKTAMTKAELESNATQLKGVLEDFGIRGDVVSVRPGPIVTLYELVPAPGIKASRIISLADDIARSMSAISARVAVIPGKNALGIELPNSKRQMVYLRDLFAGTEYEEAGESLALVLGKNISGKAIVQDLAKMPHLLVAGTTGSGKSVSMNAMILSLLYRLTPDQCKLIMIDPKMLEFSAYDGIPHLLTPVVTDPKKAIVALKWVVREMENRYRAMSDMGVRNIQGYNAKLTQAKKAGEVLSRRVQTGFDRETGKPIFENQNLNMTPLPNIVVVVDEMADLMLVAGKDVEAAIQRLAQMARAAGIHLIMATQRPSVDVITGTIKANFPTRISFQVTSKIDSRTILGEGGAEQLLGQGDMLFMAGGGRITRVHAPYVSDADVEKVVKFLKAQGTPEYVDTVTEESDEPSLLDLGSGDNEGDELFAKAVDLVRRERKASTSFVQRCLKIGYNRAARIIDQMEKEDVVSSANHVGRREVLIPPLNDQG